MIDLGDSLAQFEVVEEEPRMPATPSSPGSTNVSPNGPSAVGLNLSDINAGVDENEGL